MPERTGENIMGIQPVPKLVLGTGLPLTVSALINSLYNFVDSVFVSRVSEAALTAVSLSSPMQILISALGSGIAVGLNAVISKALGRLIAVPCLVLAAGFQGLSRAAYSTVLTILRQAALPLALMPAALAFRDLMLVWSAFLGAELLTLPLGAVMWKRVSGRTLGSLSQSALPEEP